MIVDILLGAGITIFGSLGLFAIKRHPADIRDTRLYLLILYIDFWCLAVCLTTFIVSHMLLLTGTVTLATDSRKSYPWSLVRPLVDES